MILERIYMITISVCAQKGGVSKTTTTEALILGLRRLGFKVLAMDLDQQGNLTGYFNPEAKYSVFDLVYGKVKASECVENDLIAGGLGLRYLPEFFKENELTELGNAVKRIGGDYDFLIIDTPPAINTVVLSALANSDYVILPTEPTRDSLDGIMKTIQAIEATQAKNNPELKILGVLLVKYKDRYTLHRQFKEALSNSKKFKLFKTVIRESQAINAAKTANVDFFSKQYSKANAVLDYTNFVDEVLGRMGIKAKKKK